VPHTKFFEIGFRHLSFFPLLFDLILDGWFGSVGEIIDRTLRPLPHGEQRTAELIALPHDLANSVRAITVSEEEENPKTHIPNQAKSGNAKRQLHE
jgi:hypothetical protein